MYFIENSISRIKNFSRRNFIWFYPICSLILISIIFYYKHTSIISKVDHELLITVLSTLSGFLLTLLGILFSFRDKSFIQELIKADIWTNVEQAVFLGLMSGSSGLIISFLNTLLSTPHWILIFLEINLFIFTLVFLSITG